LRDLSLEEPVVTFETILVEPGQVTEIILNRPERANAITTRMEEELFGVLDEAEADPSVRAIIIRGNGRHFCSGGDMYQAANWRATGRPYRDESRTRDGIKDLALWQDYRKPIIAAVQGYLGAQAVRWVLVCDLIVAAEGAQFSYQGLRAGATPVALISTLTLGHKKIKEWQLLAGSLSAEEAERHGLVNKVVPLDQLYPTARQWAQAVVNVPPDVALTNKHLINQVYEMFGSPTHYFLSNLGNVVSHGSSMDNEFYRVIVEKGLRAALEWRDSQLDSDKLVTASGPPS
jgi:2-(1,2-epoxy-1,2-dihydrophenyl)acetyl-CoA isomerase